MPFSIKPKNLWNWFELAVIHISAPELIVIGINVATFILSGSFTENFYLWCVILFCDILMLLAHGAYLEAKPGTERGPWYTPAPFIVRTTFTSILFLLLAEGRTDSILSNYAWYVLTMTAVCHAFYCILLTMHARNDSWLEGTDGRVGTPNWISIGRMALAVLVPHLLTVQPFGQISNIIATVIMALAIITDAADGYVARKFDQITKAGKALDPLGDKIIFYPMVVAFMIATSATALLPTMELRIVFYVCLAIMLARDILFIVWFFLYYTKMPAGIGASMVDKVRMAVMCIWLGVAVLALTIQIANGRLAIASFVCMALIAILSIASVFVDYSRIRAYMPYRQKDKTLNIHADFYELGGDINDDDN